MPTVDTVVMVAAVLGPLVGAWAGTYFGLKGAINGLVGRTERMDETLGQVRDYTRDASLALQDHVHEGRRTARQIDQLHTELMS